MGVRLRRTELPALALLCGVAALATIVAVSASETASDSAEPSRTQEQEATNRSTRESAGSTGLVTPVSLVMPLIALQALATADGWLPISPVGVAESGAKMTAAAFVGKDEAAPSNLTESSSAERDARMLRHPVYSRIHQHLHPKRAYNLHRTQDGQSSNKVEVFVAPPHGMLGSFSAVGPPASRGRVPPHEKPTPSPSTADPAKKTPAVDKLHAQETRYVLDSRVSFPYELLSPSAGLSRPVQYKNPTDPDVGLGLGIGVRKQHVAADEPRPQVVFLGHHHGGGHVPHSLHNAPSQTSGFKFIPASNPSGVNYYDRPQLQVFSQQTGLGANHYLQTSNIGQSPFAQQQFSNAPIYGQSAENFRPENPTQTPLYLRGSQVTRPQTQQLHQQHIHPHQHPHHHHHHHHNQQQSASQQHLPQPQIPEFRFVPPLTSTALDHSSFGGLSQAFGPPADRLKSHQQSLQTIKQPAQQAEVYGRYTLEKPAQQAPISSQQKPIFQLKDTYPTKDSVLSKRPVNNKPLIPSQQFPSEEYDEQPHFAQAKPSKVPSVNFGFNPEDSIIKRPVNKIKIPDTSSIDAGPLKSSIVQGTPIHSFPTTPTRTTAEPVRPRPTFSQSSEQEDSGFQQRQPFSPEDARPNPHLPITSLFSQNSGIQQRPPEKIRITRPYFQEDIHGHHEQHGFKSATSPNYGPQTFPTAVPVLIDGIRPHISLFNAVTTPETVTSQFRDEVATLPPAHLNEVHLPQAPVRPTPSTRHRFQSPLSESQDESATTLPPKQEEKPTSSYNKRGPIKSRRRKPGTSTSTTTETPVAQYEGDYYGGSATDSPNAETYELRATVQTNPEDNQQQAISASSTAETPYTTTIRPSSRPRKKPVARPTVNDRLRNRLVPPELIRTTTTPEPETTTNILFAETTTYSPDFSPEIREPEIGITYEEKTKGLQDYSHVPHELFSGHGFGLSDYSQDFIQKDQDYTKLQPEHNRGEEENYPKTEGDQKLSFVDGKQGEYENVNLESGNLGSSLLSLDSVAPTSVDASSPQIDYQLNDPQTTLPPPSIETTTPSLSNRLRPRIRYNSTRPRFSVKDYHDRSRKPSKDSSETLESKPEASSTTASPRLRYPSRQRGSHRHTTERDTETSTSAPESNRLRYRTKDPLRFSGGRQRSTTTTTSTEAPDAANAGSEVSTERSATYKPPAISRFRPGTGKYFSRYRTSTSTEAPVDSVKKDDKPTIRLPARTKGVFSVRRPQTTTKAPFESEPDANQSGEDNYPSSIKHLDSHPTRKTYIQRFGEFGKSDREQDKANENEVVPSTSKTRSDPSPTLTSSPEESLPQPSNPSWSEPTAASAGDAPPTRDSVLHSDLSDVQIDSSAEDMILSPSQRVADLTSSPNNHYNNPSIFKSVMPASGRSPLKISISTDDPILPIEAFFNSWSKDSKSS